MSITGKSFRTLTEETRANRIAKVQQSLVVEAATNDLRELDLSLLPTETSMKVCILDKRTNRDGIS